MYNQWQAIKCTVYLPFWHLLVKKISNKKKFAKKVIHFYMNIWWGLYKAKWPFWDMQEPWRLTFDIRQARQAHTNRHVHCYSVSVALDIVERKRHPFLNHLHFDNVVKISKRNCFKRRTRQLLNKYGLICRDVAAIFLWQPEQDGM